MPEPKPLDRVCVISDRLGCLKVEQGGITKFFCQAAKVYCYETLDDQIVIKAKGFSLFEKLLKDNGQSRLIENNIVKMFSGLGAGTRGELGTTVKIFQKQINVNPEKMVPALKPSALSFKLLSFVGPRRQIDLQNWLDFTFERRPRISDPPIVPLSHQKAGSGERDGEGTDYQVVLVPKIRGFLPAFPYGFDMGTFASSLPFYALSRSISVK